MKEIKVAFLVVSLIILTIINFFIIYIGSGIIGVLIFLMIISYSGHRNYGFKKIWKGMNTYLNQ
jgi:hypothetical protein